MIKKIIVSVSVVLALAMITGFISLNQIKVAYVNTYTVYNDFKLKKELEAKLDKTVLTRKVLLDSLRMKIQMASLDSKKMEDPNYYSLIQKQQESYYLKEKQYSEDNTAQAQKYTDEVWKQLNQYIKEYGAENGYDYIIGTTGEGNLMYAKEKHDISKDLVEFVNGKYQGK